MDVVGLYQVKLAIYSKINELLWQIQITAIVVDQYDVDS
jgi:methyl coenzyme M reductase subunit C